MTIREFINPHVANPAFEKDFSLEMLQNDRLRVTILLIAWIASFLLISFLSIFFYDSFQRIFHGNFRGFLFTFAIGTAIVVFCLLLERMFIKRSIRRRKDASPFLRYLSAFIETSIPSLGMLVVSSYLGPIYSLFTPAPLSYAIFIVLSVLRLDFRLSVFTGFVAGIEYALLAIWFVSRDPAAGTMEPILAGIPQHLVRGSIFLIVGIVAGVVALQIRRRVLSSLEMAEERNRISRTFGEYVSPAVMQTLMTLKPDLRSESKNVCVMFLDIRDFTGFAEKRRPEEVVQYLESLFEFMIEIVNRHNGIINKFLGDGFMAVFGAPLSDGRDATNAVEAAREILARVNEETERGAILPTRVGIGLHAGEAVTGSIGSALRREYTVIGDVVNLAARIEKLNKEFGSQLLMSEMVWEELHDGGPDAVPIGNVQVRGREEPIQIYQIA
jgi:adenylate cyclase